MENTQVRILLFEPLEVRVDDQVAHLVDEGDITEHLNLLSLDLLHIAVDSLVITLTPVAESLPVEKLHFLAEARSHILDALFHLNWVTKAIAELEEVWDAVRTNYLEQVVDINRAASQTAASEEHDSLHAGEEVYELLFLRLSFFLQHSRLIDYANLELARVDHFKAVAVNLEKGLVGHDEDCSFLPQFFALVTPDELDLSHVELGYPLYELLSPLHLLNLGADNE